MLPIECVVRGYLAGSGWKDYLAQRRGLRPPPAGRSRRVRTAARADLHPRDEGPDRPRREHRPRSRRRRSSASERFEEVERLSLALYRAVSERAAARGIILADTKLEFGIDRHGALVLADEAFTPDSSRFWPAEEYAPGGPQPSFDKQFVRDYCESLGWDKTAPGPELPAEVVEGTRRRYVEAFERLTGIAFEAYLDRPGVVLG